MSDSCSEPSVCFHCGLPVPPDTRLPIHYQNTEQPACCAGCQTVAQGIIDAGLGGYYQNRTAAAQQAALPPDEILAQLKLYDLPEMQAGFVETLPENEKEAVLMLGGITCAACVWLVEQRLLRQGGIVKAELNYSTQRARVRWDDSRIRLSQILSLIRETGYTAAPYDAQKVEEAAQQERKKMLTRLAVAGLASMQTMMFALPTYLYADIEPQYLTMLHWGAFLMVLPAVFYSAQPFFAGAWRDLRNKRTGMDTPISIAVVLTFIAGVYALYHHAAQGMYFESIAMLVLFLLIGRFMEQNARRKAGDAAERLVKLVPAFCHRLPEYPNERSEEAAVVSLQCGDVLAVRAGEVIPADGTVLSGESEVNESVLTGEHLPVAKSAGSRVTAGTLNTAAPLIIRAEQIGSDTRLAHIVKLLDRALAQKPRLAQLAERYASGFTLSMIVMSLPVFLGWWLYAGAGTALWVTVSLLVITCPCALSLATPAALAASTGKLAGQGILIARGHVLESLPQISDAVFDKTGTLTQGRLTVSRIHTFSGSLNRDTLIAVAQALETHSEHPIARAIAALPCTAPPECTVTQRSHRAGHGISASVRVNGISQTWAIGTAAFVGSVSGSLPEAWHDWAQQGSLIALGNQDGFQAAFLLTDTIKHDAAAVLVQLAAQGIALHILSGDNAAAVAQTADSLNIAHRRAAAAPEDKLAYVQQLQQQGKRVLMLGDGINDAPVLAAADVSVAVAGSADAAREGADVLLMNDDFSALPQLLAQAERTRSVIRQNLYWASGYNLIVIPLAAAGCVTPWIAAIGMSFSSLLVVWNALRLRR